MLENYFFSFHCSYYFTYVCVFAHRCLQACTCHSTHVQIGAQPQGSALAVYHGEGLSLCCLAAVSGKEAGLGALGDSRPLFPSLLEHRECRPFTLYVCLSGSHSGVHTCVAGALTLEPSSQPKLPFLPSLWACSLFGVLVAFENGLVSMLVVQYQQAQCFQ